MKITQVETKITLIYPVSKNVLWNMSYMNCSTKGGFGGQDSPTRLSSWGLPTLVNKEFDWSCGEETI